MPGSAKRSEVHDTIFSAILPSEAAALRADEITRKIYAEHGLDGKPRPVSQFHVTVVYFGLFVDLGDDGIDRARRACAAAAARTAPFQAELNQGLSFPRPAGRSAPLVLTYDQKHPGFDACYRAAFDEAKAMDLVKKRERYTPHLTTGYSVKRVPPQAIAPISWTVTELVLLRSFYGLTRYEELGRWTLSGAVQLGMSLEP